MSETENKTPLHTDELRVVYIHYVGESADGQNIYHFYIGENYEDVWSDGWWETAGNLREEMLMIDENMYSYVKELKTDLTLDLATRSPCFSMQDCRDHCVALAWEDISQAEEYPEDGRIVIQFGEPLDDVEVALAKRNMFMKFI